MWFTWNKLQHKSSPIINLIEELIFLLTSKGPMQAYVDSHIDYAPVDLEYLYKTKELK